MRFARRCPTSGREALDFSDSNTGNFAVAVLIERGHGNFTGFNRVGATRVKSASWGRIDRRGRVTRQNDPFTAVFFVGVRGRNRANQGSRVGVHRFLDDVVGRAEFDNFTEIHHGDPVGNVLHHGKVMGDEDQTESHLLHELGEQVEDLRLDGDVEGGDGLIGDHDFGSQGESASDGDALTLAAGKLVRIFLHESGRETDGFHELGDVFEHLGRFTNFVD